MKHVLVVGGFRFIPDQLKKLDGVKMTMLIETEEIIKQNQENFERIIGVPKDASVEEWVKFALHVHEVDPIQAIGAYHEMNQDKAAEIAERLGIPFHSKETIEYTRDKFLMRKRLQETGVDLTASQIVTSEADMFAFADQYGYPVVLKPVSGWASIGVSVIRSESDVQPAVEWFTKWAPDEQMYVEQYLAGEEFSVEAFSEEGKHQIVCITRKFKDEVHLVELGHVLPAVLAPEEEQAIHQLVLAALDAFGVWSGGSHTEVILTTEGPHVVESHVRLGGDFIPDMIEVASGVNLYEVWARQTTGEKVLDEVANIRFEKSASIWFHTPEAIGTLVEVKGVDEAEAAEGTERVWVWRPGSIMRGMHHSFSRSSYVISSGTSEKHALERAQNASKKLRFIVEC